MLLSAPAGNDILFDESLCEQGRNFCNKIWNAFRLVKGWQVSDADAQPTTARRAIAWFEALLDETSAEMKDLYSKYRLNEALMLIFRLFRDEFSGWYLEMVKPAYGSPIDAATLQATLGFFEQLLQLLHPFMPFITEELWQQLKERNEGESIMVSLLNIAPSTPEGRRLVAEMDTVKSIITNVRSIRAEKNISPKKAMLLEVSGENPSAAYDDVVMKMANVETICSVSAKSEGAASFMVGTTEYAVPLGDLIDVTAEIEKAEAELKHLEGFLAGVMKKLQNEKFVAHAPEQVVALEKKKKSDAESKIATLKETLAALKK